MARRNPNILPVVPPLAEKAVGKGIIPYIPAEIDNFEREVRAFQAGEYEDPNEFRAFRLQHGTYGQRQPDNQMMRVKIPFGGLTAEQLDALGEVAERYTPLGRGHVTTRQNIQYHFVQLADTPAVMRLLGSVGLTTREACANTVRNVTADPLAGVATDEVFDVTPYAAAYARLFVRNPVCQRLPRKFKTAFSGSPADRGLIPMHDLGFLARLKDGKRGFKMVVGGGTSTVPRKAPTLFEFVPVEDYLVVSEAVLRVFDRDGERKNRNKARIKFLVDKIGIDEFRRRAEEELKGPWAQELRAQNLDPLFDVPQEELEAPAPRPGIATTTSTPDFEAWRLTNVRPQKQPGYAAAYVTLPLGDLSAQQFHDVADICRKYAGGRLRTTVQQNVVLRWVPQGLLPDLYQALQAAGLGQPGAETIADVTSCPGADSCSLAVTASRGLAASLSQTITALELKDPQLNRLQIKISGCPNGCGQHHIGSIGFQGASFHADGRQVPAYDVFVGGGILSEQVARYGQRVGKVAARQAPQALKSVLYAYLQQRQGPESFEAWVDRVGVGRLKTLIAPFASVKPLSEEPDTYMDWGQRKLYQVERGEGECAGVMV
ncbi:MAG: nitrite/sulfite reductase [Chloroflexi bacterium]|nr:nitrite/sulfite reductase [Chloroflexota bacterium]